MPVIYCQVNDFDKQVKVFRHEDSGVVYNLGTIDYNNLTNTVPVLCKENNIYNVHLFGTQQYLDYIAQEIKMNENLNYSQNKINIEVN